MQKALMEEKMTKKIIANKKCTLKRKQAVSSFFIKAQLIYNVVLISACNKVTQLYIYIYIHSFYIFFSIYPRRLDIVHSAIYSRTQLYIYSKCNSLHLYGVPRCIRLFETLWTVAHQASQSTKFSRQEYWSGLLFPPPGTLS